MLACYEIVVNIQKYIMEALYSNLSIQVDIKLVHKFYHYSVHLKFLVSAKYMKNRKLTYSFNDIHEKAKLITKLST